MESNEKITIIFPPGDQLTSLLVAKESSSKIEDVLKRLCALRAIDFDLKRLSILNQLGEEVDISQTVGESGLYVIDIVDKKEEKKVKEKKEKDYEPKYSGKPKGVEINVGTNCYLPLEQQLFDEEKRALNEFKILNSEICKNFSDEFIMACLMARKMDSLRALELLKNNFKWRKENNLMNLPKISELPRELFDHSISVPGTRDKLGRAIKYIFPAETPGQGVHTVENYKRWYAYHHYVSVYAEGMDALRNGANVVVDLSKASFKNFDLDFQRQTAPLWGDTFPQLIRRTNLMNPPSFMNVMMKIMRTIVKAKLMDRMKPRGNVKDIEKDIDKSNLIQRWGGDLAFDSEKSYGMVLEWAEKNEERLSAPGRQ